MENVNFSTINRIRYNGDEIYNLHINGVLTWQRHTTGAYYLGQVIYYNGGPVEVIQLNTDYSFTGRNNRNEKLSLSIQNDQDTLSFTQAENTTEYNLGQIILIDGVQAQITGIIGNVLYYTFNDGTTGSSDVTTATNISDLSSPVNLYRVDDVVYYNGKRYTILGINGMRLSLDDGTTIDLPDTSLSTTETLVNGVAVESGDQLYHDGELKTIATIVGNTIAFTDGSVADIGDPDLTSEPSLHNGFQIKRGDTMYLNGVEKIIQDISGSTITFTDGTTATLGQDGLSITNTATLGGTGSGGSGGSGGGTTITVGEGLYYNGELKTITGIGGDGEIEFGDGTTTNIDDPGLSTEPNTSGYNVGDLVWVGLNQKTIESIAGTLLTFTDGTSIDSTQVTASPPNTSGYNIGDQVWVGTNQKTISSIVGNTLTFSDGTTADSGSVTDDPPNTSGYNIGDQVWVGTEQKTITGIVGNELSFGDGTSTGGGSVTTEPPNTSGYNVGDQVWVGTNQKTITGIVGNTLTFSDGTTADSGSVTDDPPNTSGYNIGDQVWVGTNQKTITGIVGNTLTFGDGTTSGSGSVTDDPPNTSGYNIGDEVYVGGVLKTITGIVGNELTFGDGSTSGSGSVSTTPPNTSGYNVGDQVWVGTNQKTITGIVGDQLTFGDGTTTGSGSVTDDPPNTSGYNIGDEVYVGGVLKTITGIVGNELTFGDGSTSGSGSVSTTPQNTSGYNVGDVVLIGGVQKTISSIVGNDLTFDDNTTSVSTSVSSLPTTMSVEFVIHQQDWWRGGMGYIPGWDSSVDTGVDNVPDTSNANYSKMSISVEVDQGNYVLRRDDWQQTDVVDLDGDLLIGDFVRLKQNITHYGVTYEPGDHAMVSSNTYEQRIYLKFPNTPWNSQGHRTNIYDDRNVVWEKTDFDGDLTLTATATVDLTADSTLQLSSLSTNNTPEYFRMSVRDRSFNRCNLGVSVTNGEAQELLGTDFQVDGDNRNVLFGTDMEWKIYPGASTGVKVEIFQMAIAVKLYEYDESWNNSNTLRQYMAGSLANWSSYPRRWWPLGTQGTAFHQSFDINQHMDVKHAWINDGIDQAVVIDPDPAGHTDRLEPVPNPGRWICRLSGSNVTTTLAKTKGNVVYGSHLFETTADLFRTLEDDDDFIITRQPNTVYKGYRVGSLGSSQTDGNNRYILKHHDDAGNVVELREEDRGTTWEWAYPCTKLFNIFKGHNNHFIRMESPYVQRQTEPASQLDVIHIARLWMDEDHGIDQASQIDVTGILDRTNTGVRLDGGGRLCFITSVNQEHLNSTDSHSTLFEDDIEYDWQTQERSLVANNATSYTPTTGVVGVAGAGYDPNTSSGYIHKYAGGTYHFAPSAVPTRLWWVKHNNADFTIGMGQGPWSLSRYEYTLTSGNVGATALAQFNDLALTGHPKATLEVSNDGYCCVVSLEGIGILNFHYNPDLGTDGAIQFKEFLTTKSVNFHADMQANTRGYLNYSSDWSPDSSYKFGQTSYHLSELPLGRNNLNAELDSDGNAIPYSFKTQTTIHGQLTSRTGIANVSVPFTDAHCISLSGDGKTLAIGVPRNNPTAVNGALLPGFAGNDGTGDLARAFTGSVYVLEKGSTGLFDTVKCVVDHPWNSYEPNSDLSKYNYDAKYFGEACSLNYDGTIMYVGCPGWNEGAGRLYRVNINTKYPAFFKSDSGEFPGDLRRQTGGYDINWEFGLPTSSDGGSVISDVFNLDGYGSCVKCDAHGGTWVVGADCVPYAKREDRQAGTLIATSALTGNPAFAVGKINEGYYKIQPDGNANWGIADQHHIDISSNGQVVAIGYPGSYRTSQQAEAQYGDVFDDSVSGLLFGHVDVYHIPGIKAEIAYAQQADLRWVESHLPTELDYENPNRINSIDYALPTNAGAMGNSGTTNYIDAIQIGPGQIIFEGKIRDPIVNEGRGLQQMGSYWYGSKITNTGACLPTLSEVDNLGNKTGSEM